MIDRLKSFIIRYLANSYIQSSESKMFSSSEKKALKSFRHAATASKYYQKILNFNHVDPEKINTIDDFKQLVPVTDKASTFTEYKDRISLLTSNESLNGVASILCSSGTSNAYSFGLLTPKDNELGPEFVDFGLDLNFNILMNKTLLINCLPMGVRVPSNHCVVADVSVRKDTAVAVVNGFGKDFDLIVFVGENSFIKEVLEYGIESGMDWKEFNIRIVIGGEGFPENFRTYIGRLLGYDPLPENDVIIGSSMGISELGLTVFQENKYTTRIRRFIDWNKGFRSELFGPECKMCPMLFVYYPRNIYLEEDTSAGHQDHVGNDLIFTNLTSKPKIPLIRYLSGDRGKIIKHSEIALLLKQNNREDLVPPIELPFVAVFERGKVINSENNFVLAEAVKAGIYSVTEIPGKFTGNFKISRNKSKIPLIEIQLKVGIKPESALENQFEEAIRPYFNGKFIIRLDTFESFPYPLDYERKFKYID